MEIMTSGGRVLSKGKWRGAHWPCIDIEPYDPAYFATALQHIAAEFGIGMPEIEEAEPQDRGGSSTDFVIRRAGRGVMNGQRCSIARQ